MVRALRMRLQPSLACRIKISDYLLFFICINFQRSEADEFPANAIRMITKT